MTHPPWTQTFWGHQLKFPLMGGHFPLGELGLGLFTPSKAHKVSNLNTFRFDKASRKIVQQQDQGSSQ
jgi:hypothetical protein